MSKNDTQNGRFYKIETRITTKGKSIKIFSLPLLEGVVLLTLALIFAAIVGGIYQQTLDKRYYTKAVSHLTQRLVENDQFSGEYLDYALDYLKKHPAPNGIEELR